MRSDANYCELGKLYEKVQLYEISQIHIAKVELSVLANVSQFTLRFRSYPANHAYNDGNVS